MNTVQIRQKDSQVGFEFEFVRDKSYNLGAIKKSLKRLFKVDISIEKEHHSDFVPTETEWKLEPDFSGGVHLVELVTGPLPYPLARIVLLNMLKWIREENNIYLTRKCGLHINVNVDGPYIQNIDILKYILHFNEDLVYKYFPDREDNIYAKTIKAVYPRHPQTDLEHLVLNPTNYVYPSNKYYGINFTKLANGYLEFRYLGGEKYAERSEKVLELMDYFIDSLIDCYRAPYTPEDRKHLAEIVNHKYPLFLATRSYFNFKNVFKKLRLFADADDNEEVIKSHFPNIMNYLFPIFQKMEKIDYNMRGIINYDSDESTLEFSQMKLKDTVIDSLRLTIYESEITQCVLENTNIVQCKTFECDLNNVDSDGTQFVKTRVKNGHHQDGVMDSCYIDGDFITLDRFDIKGDTIFRKGKYRHCDIADTVEMIDAEEAENNLR